MLCDPAAAAWVAAGQPAVEAPATLQGRCGRCGGDDPTVASSRIVGEKFTGFETWPFGSRRLCTPCAWAYSQAPTTQPARTITTTTTTEHRDPAAMADLLTADALPPTHAVVVPTSRRRHILPTAEWGHLATDGLVVAWDIAAAARLADLRWLRTTVAPSWPQLGRAAPPSHVLTSQPPERWARILAAWTALQPWRSIPPLWAAARLLTNTPASPSSS